MAGVSRGDVQRCASFVVAGVRIGVGIEQGGHDPMAGVSRGDVQGGAPFVVAGTQIGVGIEQDGHDPMAGVSRGDVQGGAPPRVTGVRIGAGIEQGGHDPMAGVSRGDVQRCASFVVAGVRIDALAEEFKDSLQIVLPDNGMQGGAPCRFFGRRYGLLCILIVLLRSICSEARRIAGHKKDQRKNDGSQGYMRS